MRTGVTAPSPGSSRRPVRGGEALFSALDAHFAAAPAKGFVVELGCSVGRGLAMLRRKSALAVGIDLHLPALRAARRLLLRGETLPLLAAASVVTTRRRRCIHQQPEAWARSR